jgi:hypothetical protein
MLASTLDHHAGEEEELMFFQAKPLGADRLATLGERWSVDANSFGTRV